jgi:glutamate-1-semialdehyde 2,1-aminomutase
MVRFGKSGTDVTTAAVRLARAYTGRNHVMATGYHGWADWSMSRTDRNSGIPGPVRSLTHLKQEFDYEYYAAIVVEPNDDPDHLKWLREVCDKFGIVLIFDEVITGFRYDLGGAQKVFGVTPDLACFGKGMANGMPISALVGKKEIMKKLDTPDVFFSGTFFGETLSMAAAIATINKLEREDVIAKITKNGYELEDHINFVIEDFGLEEAIKLSGWQTNTKISFNDFQKLPANQMRALFMSKMAQEGVLIINCNGLTYAHREPELKRIKTAYEEAIASIFYTAEEGTNMVGIAASPLRKAV